MTRRCGAGALAGAFAPVAGFLSIAVLLAVLVAPPAPRAAGTAAFDPTATPVLVELFSSESCSKCPPADSVLAQIERTQPVDGARIITIAFHVTWAPTPVPDWVDPFATASFDARQKDYASSLQRSGLYTPQAIIDGNYDLPGYNYTRLCRAISRAADEPKPLAVTVLESPSAGDSLTFTIMVKPQGGPAAAATPPGPSEILLALVEDGLVSRVTAGENAGRTLKHDRVVRELVSAGRLDAIEARAPKTVTVRLAAPPAADRARFGAVAFVQETAGRRVVGATETTLR